MSYPSLIFITLLICTLTFISGCAGTAQHNSGRGVDSSSPHDAEGKSTDLINDAFIHLSSGNPDLAKMLFLRVLSQEPNSTQAYIGLGDVDYQVGQYENAYLSYQKAATLAPESVRAMIGKAQSQRQQNKLNAAIKEINAAMSIEPNSIRVLTELAIIYDLLGKETLSAPIYQEILSRAPDQAASNNNIGLNYLARTEYDEAILAFQRALSLDPRNNLIKNNLGTAFALYGDEQTAINIFTETVSAAGAYNNLGYLYMTQGRLNDAERALRKAMELNPKHYEKAQVNLDRVNQLRRAEK